MNVLNLFRGISQKKQSSTNAGQIHVEKPTKFVEIASPPLKSSIYPKIPDFESVGSIAAASVAPSVAPRHATRPSVQPTRGVADSGDVKPGHCVTRTTQRTSELTRMRVEPHTASNRAETIASPIEVRANRPDKEPARVSRADVPTKSSGEAAAARVTQRRTRNSSVKRTITTTTTKAGSETTKETTTEICDETSNTYYSGVTPSSILKKSKPVEVKPVVVKPVEATLVLHLHAHPHDNTYKSQPHHEARPFHTRSPPTSPPSYRASQISANYPLVPPDYETATGEDARHFRGTPGTPHQPEKPDKSSGVPHQQAALHQDQQDHQEYPVKPSAGIIGCPNLSPPHQRPINEALTRIEPSDDWEWRLAKKLSAMPRTQTTDTANQVDGAAAAAASHTQSDQPQNEQHAGAIAMTMAREDLKAKYSGCEIGELIGQRAAAYSGVTANDKTRDFTHKLANQNATAHTANIGNSPANPPAHSKLFYCNLCHETTPDRNFLQACRRCRKPFCVSCFHLEHPEQFVVSNPGPTSAWCVSCLVFTPGNKAMPNLCAANLNQLTLRQLSLISRQKRIFGDKLPSSLMQKDFFVDKIMEFYKNRSNRNASRDNPEQPAHSQQPKDQSKNMEISKICTVCLNKPANCIVLDCRHVFGCRACCDNMKNCPICRKKIRSCITFFPS